MAVTAPQAFGQDGFGESHRAFVRNHSEDSIQLLNLAEDKPKEAPRPAYDPNHPDNAWPLMLHSPKGELTIGKSLKGITNQAERAAIVKANELAKREAVAQGYRPEPYIKPQVAVLDPAAEKANLIKRNDELDAALRAQTDVIASMKAALEELQKAKA
jgi:hypothetical protein